MRIATSRYRNPFRTLIGLDLVAIAPIILRVLEVIVENEQVSIMNDIEVALPGDVIRLEDRDPLALHANSYSNARRRRLGMPESGVSSAR